MSPRAAFAWFDTALTFALMAELPGTVALTAAECRAAADAAWETMCKVPN